MSPAQRFMHADAGGYLLPSCIASLPTVSKISSNTIRKAINACTDLSKGEKRMLSEVCSFVQLGKTGVCDAKNSHFVTECLIAKDSVSRILAKLEDKGLVTVDPGKERGNKRLIWPTKRALALYMTPAQLGALGGEVQAPELSTNVDTPIDQIMQTLSTFVDTPIDFLQGGLSTFSGEAIDFLRDSLLIVKERYLNVIKNDSNTPTPQGVGAASPSKKNEGVQPEEKLPSESPSLTSVNSGGAAAGELPEAERTEARTLATAIALNWQISEQKNFQKWARIFRFAQLLTAAGQLDELRRQFKAYHSYRHLRGIAPYNLNKYLGHETNLSPEGMPYADGEWCGRDWQATLQEEQQAQATKAAARTSHGPAPTATHVAGSQAQRVARQEEKSFI